MSKDAAAKPADYRKAFDDLKVSLANVLEQIEDEKAEPKGSQTDLEQFKHEVTKCCQAINMESNKMALGFKSTPMPTVADARSMGGQLEAALVQLLSLWLSLSPLSGVVYMKDVRRFFTDVGESCVLFAEALKTSVGKKQEQAGELLLQSVGVVWEKTDRAGELPKNVHDSVMRRVKIERRMVEDALRELEDAVEAVKDDEFEDPEDGWPEEDMKLVSFGVGLIKAAQAMLKKVALSLKKNGKADTEEHIQQLDRLSALTADFSAVVDDAALTIYAPIDFLEMMKEADALRTRVGEVIDGVQGQHYIVESEYKQWGAFLKKAIGHNYTEMGKIALERGVKDMKL